MPPTNQAPGTAVAQRNPLIPTPIIPTNVHELMALADIYYKAGMCSKECTRPEAVAAVIAFGLEIGIRPAAAVNSIHLTKGRATLWGDLPLGMVQASGLLERHKEWFTGEGEARTAHCILHRRGDSEGEKEFTYSIDQARRMGLFMKGGREGPWDKDPDWMLKLRARGRGLREKFADVLNGLHIGETEDDLTPPGETKVEVRPTSEPPPATNQAAAEPPTDVNGELMIGDAELAEVTRLMPTWVKIHGPNPCPSPADGVRAWKAMLQEKFQVDSAKRLTASQAEQLLATLRECEKSPTAAVFVPAENTASADQQQPQTQGQPQAA